MCAAFALTEKRACIGMKTLLHGACMNLKGGPDDRSPLLMIFSEYHRHSRGPEIERQRPLQVRPTRCLTTMIKSGVRRRYMYNDRSFLIHCHCQIFAPLLTISLSEQLDLQLTDPSAKQQSTIIMPSQHPQISDLPSITTYLTGHDDSGKAIVEATRPANWTVYDNKEMAFNVAYTTSQFPANLNDNADIKTYDKVLSSGRLGLVNPHGTVCRTVDFAPGFECMMHRTQSLDYGIVIQGEIELVLDSGERQLMGPGDIAVQRATMHSWKNPSQDKWARMTFVLQDCEKLVVGGEVMKEDHGRGTDGLPMSGNDS